MFNKYNSKEGDSDNIMKLPSPDDITRYDKLLHELALYDVTEGKIAIVRDVQDGYELQEQVVRRYNYFKRLIQTGECNIPFLQYDIYRKYSSLSEKEFIGMYGEYDPKLLLFADPEELETSELIAQLIISMMKNPDVITKIMTATPKTDAFLDGIQHPLDAFYDDQNNESQLDLPFEDKQQDDEDEEDKDESSEK